MWVGKTRTTATDRAHKPTGKHQYGWYREYHQDDDSLKLREALKTDLRKEAESYMRENNLKRVGERSEGVNCWAPNPLNQTDRIHKVVILKLWAEPCS